MRLEQHARTTWVKRGDGWVDVDTTLVFDAQGRVVPKVTSAELAFSGGGASPLASVGMGGKRMSMAWPGTLPKPTLQGPTATYAEVLPGVDLKVTADVDGFAHTVVVKTREAAVNPALSALRFGVEAEGLTLSSDAAGNLKARDVSGNVVLQGPTPQMWDSSGVEAGSLMRAQSLPTTSKHAEMEVSVTAGAVTFSPDQTLLTAPDTVFPVYLDPWFTANNLGYTTVWAAYPNTSYWNSGDIARVGYESQTGMVNRSFWKFDTSVFFNKQIFSATFRANNIYSWSCNAREVQLWLTYPIDQNTTWGNQPGQYKYLDARNESHGYNSGCPGAEMDFNATAAVADAVTYNWPDVTLGLYANEGDSFSWKKFANNPVLWVDYNIPPYKPTNLTVEGKPISSPRPVIGTASPTLRAYVSDADPGASLIAAFHLNRWNPATGVWEFLQRWDVNNLPSGATAALTLPPQPDGIYFANLYAWDGGAATWSDAIEFDIDTGVPKNAPTVSSPDYGANPDEIYGTIGKPGTFTFGPNGDPDVGGYIWNWNNPPTLVNKVMAAQAGQPVSLVLTPPPPAADNPTRGGLVTLQVKALSRAGGPAAPTTTYQFFVGDATGPVASWKLDEAAGSTMAADDTGNGNDLALAGATPGTPGRILDGPELAGPTAVGVDGIDDSPTSAGPVIDPSKGFTVSAWVKPDQVSDWSTIMSTSGDANSAFFLRYYKTSWVFSLAGAPNQTGFPVDLHGTSVPKVGVWTHITGVYDPGAKKIRLYVNGVDNGAADAGGSFRSSGPLVLGAGLWNNEWRYRFDGSLADVRVWDRVLSPGEVEPLASSIVGRWRLDGDGSDALSYGRHLTSSGGVAASIDRNGEPDSAMGFDGTGSFASPGPVIDPEQSFTVTGWVNLNHTTGWQAMVATEPGADWGIFVGLDQGSKTWFFAAQNNGVRAWAASTIAAVPGQWAHLAAVHDAAKRKITLYVDGIKAAEADYAATPGPAGNLTVGRGFYVTPNYFLNGSIDDVRAYHGVLSPSAITKLVQAG